MPEPQNQSDDPRAQLEQMRKIKRLQELKAKAEGQQPASFDVPYQSYAGSKPVDIMGWNPASLDDPDNLVDIVGDQFKRQSAMQPKALDRAAEAAGVSARAKALEGYSGADRFAYADLAEQEAQRARNEVWNAEGKKSPKQAMDVATINAVPLGAPGFLSKGFREELGQAYRDQPAAALTGEVFGSFVPLEGTYQAARLGANKALKPVVDAGLKRLPKNALGQIGRFGTHLASEWSQWAAQNALYRGTVRSSVEAAEQGKDPTLGESAQNAVEGVKDPINLAGPGLVLANRGRRYVSTGGSTATPADRFVYAEDLAGGVPTVMTPGGRSGAAGGNYTQGANQPAWWQEAYQRIKILLKNSGVPDERIRQGFDNIAANMAERADGRTPIAMMIEREFADLGPQARENIRTFLLKGDLDKLPSVREFIEESTNKSAQDYTDLIDTELTAERATPAQEAIEKSLQARGRDYDKVLQAGKDNIPLDAPLVVSMQQHLINGTDGPMKATRILMQAAKDRGWKDAETFIMQDPWNAAHEYRIRVAAAGRKSADKAVELQPDLEYIDDFLGQLPGYNKIKENYAKESGVRDALGWVDPDTGKVVPSFGQDLKKAGRSERETEFAARRYEGMDPRQQQAARISTAETLRDATRGVRPQGTDQFGNDVLGLRLSMLPTEGFSSHALPRTFGEAGENVSRGIDDIVNLRQFVADINANTGSNTVNKALAHQTGDDALIQGMGRDATRNTANNPGRTVDIAMLANGLPPVLWFVQKFPRIFRGLVTPGRTTRNDIAKILLAIPPSQRDEIIQAMPINPLSGRNSPRAWKKAYDNEGEGLPDVLKSPQGPMRSAGFNLQRPQGFNDDVPRGTQRFRDERLTDGQNKAVEMSRNGYSNAEIAEETGASMGTVKTWLSRARSMGVDVPKARAGAMPTASENLRPRFERGQSDQQIAQQTGMNAKTVASHRKRFNDARVASGKKPISSIHWRNAGGIGEDVQSSLMLGVAGNAGGDITGRFVDLNQDGVVDEKDRELGRQWGSLAAGAPFAMRGAGAARNALRRAGPARRPTVDPLNYPGRRAPNMRPQAGGNAVETPIRSAHVPDHIQPSNRPASQLLAKDAGVSQDAYAPYGELPDQYYLRDLQDMRDAFGTSRNPVEMSQETADGLREMVLDAHTNMKEIIAQNMGYRSFHELPAGQQQEVAEQAVRNLLQDVKANDLNLAPIRETLGRAGGGDIPTLTAGVGGRKPPKPPPLPGAGTGPKNRRHLGRGLKDLTDDNVIPMPQRKPASMGEGRTPEQLAEPFGGKPPSQWTPEEREFFVNSGHGSTADLDGGFTRQYQTVDEVKKSLGRKGMKRANQGNQYEDEGFPVIGSMIGGTAAVVGGAGIAALLNRKPPSNVPPGLAKAREQAAAEVANLYQNNPNSREFQVAVIRLQQIDREIELMKSGNPMATALMPPSRKPVAMTQ